MARLEHRTTADWVAIILAVGVSTGLNVITFAVVYSAVAKTSDIPGGISENATQLLTGWGGGMIGVLGAFVGYAFGRRAGNRKGQMTQEQPKIWVKVVEAHAVRTWVAVILTTFAGLSLLVLTAGAVWNTVTNPEVTDLSANFMTVISGALGVIFGGLSGFLGNQALQDKKNGGPLGDEQITLHVDDQTKGGEPPASDSPPARPPV